MFQKALVGLIGITLVLWALFWGYTAIQGIRSVGAEVTLLTDRIVAAYPECRKCTINELQLHLRSDSTFTLTTYDQAPDTLRYVGVWQTDSRRLSLYVTNPENIASQWPPLEYYLAVDGALQYMSSDSLLPIHTFPADD